MSFTVTYNLKLIIALKQYKMYIKFELRGFQLLAFVGVINSAGPALFGEELIG